MYSQTELPDARSRQQAVDPHLSCIVQAPAGSGKTELLVQRYLVLLTRVRSPEAIIALTFTRKAAAEMRARILHALEQAQQTSCIPGEETRWQLVKQVVAHDKAMNWHLLANPNRLRIQTIDSFCQTLTRQMPLLSRLSAHLTPMENPAFLYRIATQELMTSLESDSPWQTALLHLLGHLDNDVHRLETLLSKLLANREQWLDYLSSDHTALRKFLEQNLQNIHQECIDQLYALTPPHYLQELMTLIDFSVPQFGRKHSQQNSDQRFWETASILLLNKNNTWRKKITKAEGFPSTTGLVAMKKRMIALIQCLQNQPGLQDALIRLKNAPPTAYSESQWTTLAALLELLPVLTAHLQLRFQQHRKVDYTEILLSTLAALGNAENPTDLALHLDYQIEHLLVDEFQDTSFAQFQLIEKLTAGWEAHDGRTLFLVGDPMQSIYRFRKAEVGLFLQVQQCGIGNIQLHTLTLFVNFRSNQSLIAWFNHCFSQLLPAEDKISRGAIAFSPSVAFHQQSTEKSIHTCWFNESDGLVEAYKVVEIIQHIKQHDAQASIAIMVRARSHLLNLLPALRNASITYHAIEIESFSEKSVIQDLFTLARALLHLGDRIAWLALLRSPFCGLDLSDITAIAQFSMPLYPAATIWQQLTYFENIHLKQAAKQRLQRIVPTLQWSFQEQNKLPLKTWIKKTWMALGGPTTLNVPEDMALVHDFLNQLEKKILTEGEHLDLFRLEEELAMSFVQTTTQAAADVEIMTIHKAKGLEFDHVILPGLHRKSGGDIQQLLLYQEQLLPNKTKSFLLAPIKESDETSDRIYNYLLLEEKQKTRYELTRLLYVASTRAKKSLSLLGGLRLNSQKEISAAYVDSLLHPLWPVVSASFLEIASSTSIDQTEHTASAATAPCVKRLPYHWKNPAFSCFKPKKIVSCDYTYQWSVNAAMIIGTVIHRLFYHVSQDGLEIWDTINTDKENTRFILLLKQAGIASAALDSAVHKLRKALKNTLNDPRGRWILSKAHDSCYSEFALTVLQQGNLQNFVIDRSFIDKGTRWIIDYKTTPFFEEDNVLLSNAKIQRYKKQLHAYAAAFARDSALQGPNSSIQLGLYFPLSTRWYEWKYLPASEETECTIEGV